VISTPQKFAKALKILAPAGLSVSVVTEPASVSCYPRVSGVDHVRKIGSDGTGVGFFIPLDPSLASQFPDLAPEDNSPPHTTFLYVGDVAKDREDELIEVSSKVLQSWIRGPVRGSLTEMTYFDNPEKDRRVAVMQVRFDHDLSGLRWRLRDALLEAGFQVDDSFPLVWRPHVTLGYLEGVKANYDGNLPQGSWEFDGIEIWGMSKAPVIPFGNPTRRASRVVDAMRHEVSVELMKFLSGVARKLGVSQDVYIVGGAVRNHVLGVPVKDIDVVVDAVSLKGKDSEWFAKHLQWEIPTSTNLTTNNYGVAILTASGDGWVVAGQNMRGEVIEIANARTESYAQDTYKPDKVAPSTIRDDTYRREFTCNTLLWRLYDLAEGPDKAPILDLTGNGLRDLQEGTLRCPSSPDKTFADDSSRMIRAIKFLIKYGFKIDPEVEASIRRNKEKIRNIPPGHLSNMIITLFYETGVGKRALLEMDKLGLLDVIRDIARTDKPFREALGNWAERKADVAFLFDLMDMGMPVGRSMGFLNPAQKSRVREITVDMGVDEGATFLTVLEQPGKVIDMPKLIQELGLQGAEIKRLVIAARIALLDDPVLAELPGRWEVRIRDAFAHGKVAKTFTLNEGDPVLFGKWQNKPGVIEGFGTSDKGDPTVSIGTPKGHKEIRLFKIREPHQVAEPSVGQDGVVAEDKEALAGHTPEYQRLMTEYTMMPRTARKDKVPGGLGDKAEAKDFDPKQVAKGKKVEREHTDDPDLALEITLDHLTEDPVYYDKLEEMEKEAAAARVASRYKNKKTVKPKDGGEEFVVYEYSDRQVADRNKDKAKSIDKLRGSIDKLRAQYRKDLKAGLE
jgi:tRNA nucleotidyltransferase/poly(A) polymerase/2'-5' RNA ligase